MSNSITQDMRYRQPLMQYAEQFGVSQACRKHYRARSCIYLWRKRWNGTATSLACQSRRTHHHPDEHLPEEIALIERMCRRNPDLGLTGLLYRLRKKGYTRRPKSLYRVMRQLGMFPPRIIKE